MWIRRMLDAGIGVMLPLLLIGCGLWFLWYLRGFFWTHPRRTASFALSRQGRGRVSPLRALSVSLAGTLGVGNIVGVAVALTLGGAGAVFWMWVSALCAMVLKYAEIVLAMRYRQTGKDGGYGGPMFYMRDGIGGKTGRGMAAVFAAVGAVSAFSMGNFVQMNAAADAAEQTFCVPRAVFGAVTALLCALLVFGGYEKISKCTAILVPLVSAAYLLLCLRAILADASRVPAIFREIVSDAFAPHATAGGVAGFLGNRAMRHGVAKGAFSHEAGGGTAPMAHAGADTKIPAKQGLLGIFEVFFDTIVICTMTALVILLARDGEWITENGMHLVIWSFSRVYGKFAALFLSAAILLFAVSTVICWAYYGKLCVGYLFPSRRVGTAYLGVYCAMIAGGVWLSQGAVWLFSDLSVALMTALNLAAVVWLRREVRTETEAAGLCLPLPPK